MISYAIYAVSAIYLGLLTSISPCPLATNIAAISYVGRKVGDSRGVIAAGFLYTLGRCLLYVALAVLLAGTAMSIRSVSTFLQEHIHPLLGPIFLLLGVFLLGLVTFGGGGAVMSEKMQKRVDAMGVWGALPLGVLFAVAFCPTSAILFFGLVALILGAETGALNVVIATLSKVGVTLPETTVPGATVVLPIIYGIGTAVPVLLVAFLLAYSAKSVGKAYNALSHVDYWARRITGWVFVAAGVWFSLKYAFEAV